MTRAGAPEGVASICWAYPMEGMAALERRRAWTFSAPPPPPRRVLPSSFFARTESHNTAAH